MQPYVVEFKAVCLAADAPEALDKAAILRLASREAGLEPVVGRVRALRPEDAARSPQVARALAHAREKRFGPEATTDERRAAYAALMERCCDLDEIANSLLADLITAHGGYLPRSIALGLVASVQGAAAAEATP